MEIIFGVIVVLLSVSGAVALIKWTAMQLLRPSDKSTRVYAVLLQGENADIELQTAIDAVEWDSFLKEAKLYAVDCGLSMQKSYECQKMCEMTHFKFMTTKEFSNIYQ